MTMRTTARHMQGKARSVVLRPKRRMTIDVPRRENPKEIVFVTCCISYKKKTPNIKHKTQNTDKAVHLSVASKKMNKNKYVQT